MALSLRSSSRALALLLPLFVACSDDETAGVGTTGAGANGATGGAGGSTGGSGAGASGGDSAGAPQGGDGGSGGEGLPSSKRVFVSSLTYDGGFGGVIGGDVACQELAEAAGLGGTWLAWMSDTGGTSPPSTFTQSTEPYVLVGGDTIAEDWADLIDGTIAAPIDRDETGTPIAATQFAWTGTSAFGESVTPCCNDWSGTEAGAAVGSTTEVDLSWSFNGGQPCNMLARLYCFEQ